MFARILLLSASLAGCGTKALPEGLTPLPGGKNHWNNNGFVEMEPPIRLPVDADETFQTTILLKLPAGRGLSVRRAESHERHVLVYPAGTVADRMEKARRKRGGPHDTIADVRGTQVLDNQEVFHVYRPLSPGDTDILFQANWLRSIDDTSAAPARAAIRQAMNQGLGIAFASIVSDDARRAQAIARFDSLMRCASCHQHERAPLPANSQAGVARRGTDASGFFTIQTVLEDQAPLELYRPRDPNSADPFVRYLCDGAPTTQLLGPRGTTEVRCPSGAVPTLFYDLPAALAARDARAERICRARLYLGEHMDEEARAHFAPALAACAPRR